MRWTDAYIGLPYALGGRGPAYDCLGLFLHLQRVRHGRQLMDLSCAMKDAASDPAVLAAWRDWMQVASPMAGDAALFRVGDEGLHIGYAVDARTFLHIEGPEGSSLARVDDPRRAARFKGFWRYV